MTRGIVRDRCNLAGNLQVLKDTMFGIYGQWKGEITFLQN